MDEDRRRLLIQAAQAVVDDPTPNRLAFWAGLTGTEDRETAIRQAEKVAGGDTAAAGFA